MLPKKVEGPLDDVEILSKSFAKCLVEKGFTKGDLVMAATILLDHAIDFCPMPEAPQETPTNLKVLVGNPKKV
ncbi:MAG: hypothetical protein QNL04_02905 [SAR324 cluster bacterium]|nr:hypothetical protein [SAR324 cluster bacterium]